MDFRVLAAAFMAAASMIGIGETPSGIIAYLSGGTEIRLVSPDGSRNRGVWSPPDHGQNYPDVHDIAFRPDGNELVFSSSHESAVSFYESDLYGIGLDGKGLHRITNAPSPAELAKYPRCKVEVTITNHSSDPFASYVVVYVVGAARPKSIMLGGGTGTVTFQDVAVIPGALQPVMVAVGERRWPGPPLRLVAGRTNTASMTLTGIGFTMMGAYCPVWLPNGKEVAYRFGASAGVWKVLGEGKAGSGIGQELAPKAIARASAFDMGPASIPGGNLIYTPGFSTSGEDDRSIYQVDEAGQKTTRLVHYEPGEGGTIQKVRWLPDYSGVLYTRFEPLTFAEGINLCRYDLATKRETQITDFRNEAVRDFAISPDGQWIAFERGKSAYNPWDQDRPSLWIMRVDGSGMRKLADNAWAPAWGK